MIDCGKGLVAGRWLPPLCGPSGEKAAGGKGSVDDVPTRSEPKCAYGIRYMPMVYAAQKQGRELNMIVRGQDAARSETCVSGKGGSRNAVGRGEVGVPMDSGGVVPKDMLGRRSGGLWRDPFGSRGVGVTTRLIDRT